MKLTIIGSGTPIIRKERQGPAFLLELNNQELLFDCGWGCAQGLLKANHNPNQLDHIFITHSHADHITDLMAIIQSMLTVWSYFPEKARKKTLFIHAYKGFKKDFQQLTKIMIPEKIPFPIKISEHPSQPQKFDNFTITSTKVHHVPQYFPSVAFRIDYQDKSFVYSGDCGFDERLVKLAKNTDLLLADCSIHPQAYKKHGPFPNHLSPLEIGQIGQKAQAKEVALFHLYDLATAEAIEKEIKKNFQGEIFVTQDGDQIEI